MLTSQSQNKILFIMRKLFFSLLLLLSTLALHGQQYRFPEFLEKVRANAPRIQLLQARMEADQAAAHAENRLDDPEVSFRYMWGSPKDEVDDEKDLIVSQSFDFPTAYLHRSQVKRHDIRNAQVQYQAACHDVLLQAMQLVIELCYNDTLLALAQQQDAMSHEFLEAEKVSLNEGATSVHQFNEAQRMHMSSYHAVNQLQAEREALLAEFQAICGFAYKAHTIDVLAIEEAIIATKDQTFDRWWNEVAASSPEMQLVDNAVTRAQLGVKVARDGWLPKFSVGYEQELSEDIALRGVSVGMSIPLWSNGGKVKAARRALEVAQLEAEDQKLTFYTRLQGLFLKTLSKIDSAREFRSLLSTQNNEDLLSRTLNEGLITRPDYLEGMIGMIDVKKEALEQEKDALLLWAELNSVRY